MKQAYIVTDLSYGDAGKGTTVDYLSRQAPSPPLVIRHNGGPQAAHNVVTSAGQHHTFAQFGSGSLVPGAMTYLSEYMLINPYNMIAEASHLIELGQTDIWKRLFVSPDAVVITPWHRSANRIREEMRGNARHGSCGQGVGEARMDALQQPHFALSVKELGDDENLLPFLRTIRDRKLEILLDEYGKLPEQEWRLFTSRAILEQIARDFAQWFMQVNVLGNRYLPRFTNRFDTLIFEGAQGVLLDELYGFQPYTTWTNTTDANAHTILRDINFGGQVARLGVIRSFMTRHGPGPFVTEDATLAKQLEEPHNSHNPWQGSFRVGHLDLVAHRYAIEATRGIDGLVVTGLDQMQQAQEWRICDRYRTPWSYDRHAFFTFNPQGEATDIYLERDPFFDRQVILGDFLKDAQPLYGIVEQTPERLLKDIESELGVPIVITSYGPTADDKYLVG